MQKIKEAVQIKVKNLKNWLISRFERLKDQCIKLEEKIDEKNKKRDWHDFAQMLMNMATLAAYCTISLALAEYQKTEWFYYFSVVVILLFGGLSFWDLLCLVRWKKLKHFFKHLWNGIKTMFFWIGKACSRSHLIHLATFILIGFTVVYNYHNTKYYKSVVEVYGIPLGVGEPMSVEERQNCAGYWKIKSYPIKRTVELEYQESYGQMKVMRQYSTLYGMGIFQPASRIVCYYRKGEKDKYRGYGKEHFMTAREHDFKES